MEAFVESGRISVTKDGTAEPVSGANGTAEPVSRNQFLRRERDRENSVFFPCYPTMTPLELISSVTVIPDLNAKHICSKTSKKCINSDRYPP